MLPARLDITLAFKAISHHEGLNATERRVATAIVDSFNRKTGRCDPSLDRIAHLLGIHRRTVIRASKKLEALRLLIIYRHRGNNHCNAYQPNWPLFREIEVRWAAVKKTSHLNLRLDVSPLPVPDACHIAGGDSVTETNRTNQSNLTSKDSSPTSLVATCSRTPSGSPRKQWREPPNRPTGLRAFGAAQRAATLAAEKKWNRDLHQTFGGNEEVYAKVIQAMDAELQDAATRAELAQAGGGCCHIVHELQKRGVL
jgi:hypothetical protein